MWCLVCAGARFVVPRDHKPISFTREVENVPDAPR